jgi:restriction endonuclease S subunit
MTLDKHVFVSSGKSFRKAVTAIDNGEHFVLQMKDIEQKENGAQINCDGLVKTIIESKKPIPFLQKGDVIIATTGAKRSAFVFDGYPEKMVATQHFLILRAKEPLNLSANFIASVVNMPKSKASLNQYSTGSYQSMHSVKSLSKLPFPTMTKIEQDQFLKLEIEVTEEKAILQELIEQRETQLASLLSEYISND